jgi:hypothetical protein
MARFFNFYDPLEKRYVFNSFLVVVGLVEVLILVFTLIWQLDEGIFTESPRVVPFPWSPYLLAAFVAPIALLFLFGVIIQGFEILGQEPPEARAGDRGFGARWWRMRYLLGLLAFMAVLGLAIQGQNALPLVAAAVKFIGLGGAYGLIALLAIGLLYLWVRLWLRYRLQKQAMEYQYLLTLAERHGVVVVDPKIHPELAAELHDKINNSPGGVNLLPGGDFSEEPDPNKPDL